MLKFLQKIFLKKHLENSNSSLPFTEMWDDLGAFQYESEGFAIIYEDFKKTIKWSEITQLNVFKVDQMTIDRIDMEIVYGDKCFTISEELPGWYQFVLKTKEIFPEIPKNWDTDIIFPAFAINYKTIYEKETTKPDSI